MKTMAEMTVGESATVGAVDASDAVGMRLMEMGLVPGVDVLLRGTAPLGDPLEFEVRGYRLSVRRSEAARVSLDTV